MRKQLKGLCDKSAGSFKHITDMWKQKQVVGFTINNDETSLWSQVNVIYNASKKDFVVECSDGDREVLCDGNDSRLWQKNVSAENYIKVQPQSVLILGKR